MKVPRFWAQTECVITDEQSKARTFRVYGWSEQSMKDAEQCAHDRARNAQRAQRSSENKSWYHYRDTPLRESLLEDLSDATMRIIITRSRYGARVLNAESAAFIDIDIITENQRSNSGISLPRILGKIFTRKDPFSAKIEEIRSLIAATPSLGLRLYRTPNGFRGIFTHAPMGPRDPTTRDLLSHFDTDPLYTTLCERQGCFRARLSPKPWRIGLPAPQLKFPFTEDSDLLAIKEYEKRAEDYAACKFVQHFGNPRAHPDLLRLVKIHDEMSGALSGKPLA